MYPGLYEVLLTKSLQRRSAKLGDPRLVAIAPLDAEESHSVLAQGQSNGYLLAGRRVSSIRRDFRPKTTRHTNEHQIHRGRQYRSVPVAAGTGKTKFACLMTPE